MKMLTTPPTKPAHACLAASILVACAGLAACASTQEQDDAQPPQASQPPRAVLTDTPTASTFTANTARPAAALIDRFEIGRSAGGKPIYVYRVSGNGGEADSKPGLLIVAGLDARHAAGPTIARALVDRLEGNAALEHSTLYVVAHANPDAAGRDDSTMQTPGGTRTPEDADRDGRFDEDGPMDLNGDGFVTMMRVVDPPAKYGLSLTHIVDPDNPRLMRRADTGKGEIATHAMATESMDADGDGRMAEDGLGGVDLNHNFPYRWPEFATGNGIYPLSEAESMALATWLLGRPNIHAAIVYGPHDTIVNVPEAGRFDQTNRVPTGIESGDKPLMDRLSEMYKDTTGLSSASRVDKDGSFVGWSYAHLGLVTIASPAWQRPEPPKNEDEEEGNGDANEAAGAEMADQQDDAPAFVMIGDFRLELTQEGIQAAMAEMESLSPQEQAARMEMFQALPAATQQRVMAIAQGAPDPMAAEAEAAPEPARHSRRGGRSSAQSDDAKWLAYADEVGAGYVDWRTFDHPQLGEVEIGGFVPGFKLNAPADAIDGIIDAQADFIADVLGMMPRIEVEPPVVERVGNGVWRISIEARNDGDMPTRTAMGVKARRLVPFVMAIDVDQDRLLGGSKIVRANSMAPGGVMRAEWLVLGDAGSTVLVQFRTEEYGTTDIEIELAQTSAGGN
ncbi:MAG: hypothetical protein HRU13_04615 [Phycisphaerales bacterium]|nr:hypothetical protein [Phycisphaerales bacterium]